MSQTPEQIRAEIEATRAELASDVEDLNEKVNPARVVERKVESAKESVSGMTTTVKEKVMGTTDTVSGAGSSLKDRVMGAAHDVGDTVSGTTSTAADTAGSAAGTVKQAPAAVRQRAAGNPLVAGAVAFGVGYLLSTLLPASPREQQAAEAVKEQAASLKEPVKQQLSMVAAEMKDDLQPAAQEAAATVKDTAAEAAQTVKETASDAGTTVTEQARQSGAAVSGQAAESAEAVRQTAASPQADDLGVEEDVVIVEAYPETPPTGVPSGTTTPSRTGGLPPV